MRYRSIILTVALLVIWLPLIEARTIHIPGDAGTIQDAIDEAVNGDTVLVADGTYSGDGNRDLDFHGREIVLMSENGPEVTVIDCSGSLSDPHRGFHFHNGEGPGSVVTGFTIENGYTDEYEGGGAFYLEESSPTIASSIITGNTAGKGAGIYCWWNSSPMILDNTITNNWAFAGGGGILFEFCSDSVTIKGNLIAGNEAMNFGGGIDCNASSPTIISCTIADNTAAGGGGIHAFQYSDPTVLNSILWYDYPDEIYPNFFSSCRVDYSSIEGGWSGEGNNEYPPNFVLKDKGDYRLLWPSFCIDSGHPDYYDPDGTRVDMGAFYFDQRDSLTLYLTPDSKVVSPGSTLGVTYTVINRWWYPVTFWVFSQVILPSGASRNLFEPMEFTIPEHQRVQRDVSPDVPSGSRPGMYQYWSSVTFDEDRFWFEIVE